MSGCQSCADGVCYDALEIAESVGGFDSLSQQIQYYYPRSGTCPDVCNYRSTPSTTPRSTPASTSNPRPAAPYVPSLPVCSNHSDCNHRPGDENYCSMSGCTTCDIRYPEGSFCNDSLSDSSNENYPEWSNSDYRPIDGTCPDVCNIRSTLLPYITPLVGSECISHSECNTESGEENYCSRSGCADCYNNIFVDENSSMCNIYIDMNYQDTEVFPRDGTCPDVCN